MKFNVSKCNVIRVCVQKKKRNNTSWNAQWWALFDLPWAHSMQSVPQSPVSAIYPSSTLKTSWIPCALKCCVAVPADTGLVQVLHEEQGLWCKFSFRCPKKAPSTFLSWSHGLQQTPNAMSSILVCPLTLIHKLSADPSSLSKTLNRLLLFSLEEMAKRITDWLGLGETSKVIQFQTHSCRQDCQVQNQALDHVAKGLIYPGLGKWQI